MRCRVAMPDGTQVVCTYNTRVTSEVRGKLVAVRPDKTELVATDSPHSVDACRVQFRPRGVWAGGEEVACKLRVGDPQEAPAAEARLQPQASPSSSGGVGVYEFNLFRGRLTMEDPEHNVFTASVNPDKVEKNEKGATYDVDLAGTLQGGTAGGKAEAVVVDPMPPRLFVMARDGSASELLRPADVAGWARRVSQLGLRVEASPPEPLATNDPRDRPGGQQLVHHLIIERPQASTFAHAFPDAVNVAWHRHRLPVCAAAAAPDAHPRAPPHAIAPRVVVRRVWREVPPISAEGRAQLLADVGQCNAFRTVRPRAPPSAPQLCFRMRLC